MSFIEIFTSQLGDLFRIGLILALIATQRRTAGVTGSAAPLAAGVVFVAVLIPFTMGDPSAPKLPAVVAGLASNAVILALGLAALAMAAKLKRD